MLSFVEIVFSSIGIYGVISNNFPCMIIGLIAIIICDIVDTFVLEHNPTTIFLCILLAIGSSIANKNPIFTFSLLLCGENLITLFLGLFTIAISFIKG